MIIMRMKDVPEVVTVMLRVWPGFTTVPSAGEVIWIVACAYSDLPERQRNTIGAEVRTSAPITLRSWSSVCASPVGSL